MSLKQTLKQVIQKRGYVPLNELHQIAEDMGHKESTAERVLRMIAQEKEVIPETNGKKFIKGYRWSREPQQLNLI